MPVPNDENVTISGWTVERYAQSVKWPAVLAIVLHIIVTTARVSVSVGWLVTIGLSVFLGVMVARVYGGSVGNAAGLGFAGGLIVGVISSVFRFLWTHSVITFFQIVTTSLLSVLVGILMSTSAYLILAKSQSPRIASRTPERTQPKERK